MLLVTRVDQRRVLALGLAGLVPAALVTMLLVHQPSIGDRRLYPLLRGPLAFVGLALALVTAVTWATSPQRLTRASLSGLAWAGVTAILCIGPLLESTPRARLYALELETGDLVWTNRRAGTAPELVGDDLVVTDVEEGALIGLDPATGDERWRRRATAATAEPNDESPVDVRVALAPRERVVDVAVAGPHAYAYVATAGADGTAGGTIVAVDVTDDEVRWKMGLPETVAADAATIAAEGDAVVVAGGERIAALDADDGNLRWTASVAELGKSRGYALPGAVQHVMVADSLVYLSTAPT
jgi:outer membrane protein assembly factor BamB